MSSSKNLTRSILPLPISTYLIGFFVLALVLFALVVGWMRMQVNEVSRLENENRVHAAAAEMSAAVTATIAAMETNAERLAKWSETRQQLSNPTYYDYWRENRVLRAGVLDNFIEAAELYNPTGQPLRLDRSSLRLPVALPKEFSYVIGTALGADLVFFTPVFTADDHNDPIGYAAIQANLFTVLHAVNKLTHTDVESINLRLNRGEQLPLTALYDKLSYKPREPFKLHQIDDVLRNASVHVVIVSLLLLLIAYISITRILHTPLRNLSRHIDALRKGEGDLRNFEARAPMCVAELESLRNSLNHYQIELEAMNANLDLKNRELWNLAHHDPLTGVANRRAYDDDWKQLLELVRGQRIDVSVLLIDCDHFKAINDTYGHDVGDQVIKTVAVCLRKALRDGDRLYRLGGDEFAIHLLNTDVSHAESIAFRCLHHLGEYDFRQHGIREPVRFSIGLACANGEQPTEMSKVHRHADIAMYEAKKPGGRKVVRYSDDMEGSNALLSNRYINAVYEAIETGNGLNLYFQPVVSLTNDYPGFYEALVRLVDDKGMILPANIFPVVDAEGLENEFDLAIIRRFAEHLNGQQLPLECSVSLNLTGTTVVHDRFIEEISALLPYIGRDPNRRGPRIILEVTETAFIADLERVTRRLQELRHLGFTIALDDFGSGYSSLRYLSAMPVDIVKFDYGLVHDLLGNRSQRTISEATATMILKAGYELVAEGIENEELLDRVQALGFTHAQGYFLGLPDANPRANRSLQLKGPCPTLS